MVTPPPGDARDRAHPRVVLLTGAAGIVGSFLRPRLARPGRTLRLLDTRPVVDPTATETVTVASTTDAAALAAAMHGADAVVHLAGHHGERPWPDILANDIVGTQLVYDTAVRLGVPRVVYASSNHAVGFVPRGDGELPDGLPPRPDSFYGVGKVVGEALGSLYADRHGLDVVCLRIGSCFETPHRERALGTWLSPDDAGRLFEAALVAPVAGHRIVWGVSANRDRWWSLDAAEALGYRARDDAARHPAAAELVARSAARPPDRPEYVGGRAPDRGR